jgi:nucleoside-diphosphate-sugar epimerase
MKCLVTGGAGFIGSHIAEALARRGDFVRVLDNLSSGSRDNLAEFGDKVDFVQGDIREPLDLKRALQGVDYVFHLAALRSVERSMHDPLETHTVNATGTLQLLQAARECGIKRLVYTSSSSVYGDNRVYPQSEALKPSPISPYAVSKLAGELHAIVYAKEFGVEAVSLRYFNVFGPRQRPESQYAAVIPKFMRSALDGTALEVHSDGRQSRDFTYIENVVQANFLAATTPGASGQTFNIACGQSFSLLQMIKELEKLVGHPLQRKHFPTRAGDVRKTFADIHLAKRHLRYLPRVTVEEGLRRTWEWFKSFYTAPAAVSKTR